MKAVKIIIGLLLIIVIATPLIIIGRAETIIRSGVERFGPEAMGTDVRLEGVSLSLLDGEVIFSGFLVGNPPGYKGDHAFQVGSLGIDLDVMTIFSDHVRVHELSIDQPELIWEISKTGTNFDALRKNIMASQSESADDAEAPTITIDDLYIREARVEVTGLPVSRDLSLDLPEIHLSNIGTEDEGATYAAVADAIMKELKPVITREIAKRGVSGVAADLKSEGKQLLEEGMAEGQGELESIQEQVEEAAGEEVGGLLSGLKKKKKKDDGDGD